MLHSRLLLYLVCFMFSCYANSPIQDSKYIQTKSHFITTQNKAQKIYSLYTMLAKRQDIANNSQWRALLHYEGNKSLINKKSNFFISKIGYKNPAAEYNAFIHTMLLQELNTLYRPKKQSYNDDASILCKYPARLTFIATQLYGLERKELLTYIYAKKCIGLRMFRENVDFSSIALEFAGESNGMLHSAMGHIYLTAKRAKTQNQYDMENASEAYSISFFAISNLSFNPIHYIRVFVGGIKGAVVLMSANVVRQEYLDDEKRSLYSFKPLLNESEKRLLRQHLWELKDKEINYKFITYNCNTAIRKILGVANPLFDIRSKKPFQTPTEYLSLLHKKGLIMQEGITLPPKKQAFVEKYGPNNVTDTKKNSRISFAYAGFMQPNEPQMQYHNIQFEFSPIYIDGRNADSAYKEFMESKLMAVSGGFDFTALRPYIQKLELLKLKSVLDLSKANSFSKFFNISFEGNLYQPNHKGGFLALPNTSSHIMPTIEIGAGIGKYTEHTRWYILPRIGYRYDVMNNIYMGFESGVIASFRFYNHDFKGIFNYNYFYDFMVNNRGYDGMLYAYFGMSIRKNIDIFIESKYYHTWLKSNKIPYEATQFVQYNMGMAFYF